LYVCHLGKHFWNEKALDLYEFGAIKLLRCIVK
jgi:hypothetical protein